MKKLIILIIFSLLLPFCASAEETRDTGNPEYTRPFVRILNSQDFSIKKDFYPYGEEDAAEGINLAVADINNDSQAEIIIVPNRNAKPIIKIFNYEEKLLAEFLAYPEKYTNGLKAIAADLDNDGQKELLTAPNEGIKTEIKIFSAEGKQLSSFLPFGSKYTNGASLTAADFNNDGQIEIIAAPDKGTEPWVKIFNSTGKQLNQFLAFAKNFRGGVSVLAADLNNDQNPEIIVAPLSGSEPKIKIFNTQGELQTEFLAYAADYKKGVNLASGDINNDGKLEIMTGSRQGGGAHLRAFNIKGELQIAPSVFIFNNYRGGFFLASADLDKDGQTEILAATQKVYPPKLIEIDLSKQKLYAYRNGKLENEFIISSGKRQFPTPVGEFKINTKVPKTNMARNYGKDNPNNYNLPNVPHVMYFYRDYAIHGAYWHWKFGTRVSHGCINMKLKDAEWLYNWADINNPVVIYSSKT